MPTRRRGITRRHIIAGFFFLVGLFLLIAFVPQLRAEKPLVTRLLFMTGQPPLQVPTAPALTLIAIVYLIAGTIACVPRAHVAGTWLLWSSAALMFPAIMIGVAAGKQPTNAVTMISETLRLGTPVALGALAGIYAERCGVVNIAIEGMMLTGAGFGFAAYVATGNIWLGVIAAVVIGGLIALLHGLLSISFKTDQIISGTVINILAIGMTGYLRRQYIVPQVNVLQTLGSDQSVATLSEFSIPWLSNIPIIGPIFFVGKPIFFAMLALVLITHVVLFSTRWGLRMRAVGENPRAADTVGINVGRTRYINIVISGMIAGLGGAWLSLEKVGGFDDGMTAGKGFIALAAMIFGKWTPFGAWGGALLFGFANTMQSQIQFMQNRLPPWLAWVGQLPPQFIGMLPYLLTIAVLAGFVGRARPPAALGKVYEKE